MCKVFLYAGVLLGVFVLEGKVFKLGLYLAQSQTVGQRGVDIECLSGYLVLLCLGLHVEVAHVVQSVAYLDENDANVVAHGQQEVLEVVRLHGCLVAEHSSGYLRQSAYDECYLWAEDVTDVVDGVVGVLQYVV